MLNLIHTILSTTALLSGIIFFFKKGTIVHVRIGYVYVFSMLGCLITSMFIFDLFGAWGPYHYMAVVSIITLGLGLSFPWFFRHKPNWLIHHYMWMSYSYVGLVMAGGSHLFLLFPEWSGWVRMLLFWGLPYAVGSVYIFINRKGLIEKMNQVKGYNQTVR